MSKQCPPGKILNPLTQRCVKIDGVIGKKILAAKTKSKVDILESLKNTCNNDADPISMDAFADMTVDQLNSLVKIGKGLKKNCYLLDNIYQMYKTAVLSKKTIRDPMDPSHTLTQTEIDDINAKMKFLNPNHVPPKYILPKPYPAGYTLVIQIVNDMFTIKVMNGTKVIHDFGVVPAWIETHHTGSADHTSGVLVSNLQDIWDKRLLKLEGSGNLPLRKSRIYWQGNTWKTRFIELCNKVKEVLEN